MTRGDVVVVWTTLPTNMDVARFGRTLVEERLAACVSSQGGVKSVYRWRDGVEEDEEQQVIVKTTTDRVGRLRDRIRQLHPYEVPEILVLAVADGSSAYLDWVRESTTAPPGRNGSQPG